MEFQQLFWGPNIHTLKDKTVHDYPTPREIDNLQFQQNIQKLHNNIILGINTMYIKVNPCLIAIYSKMKFITIKFITNISL